MTIFAGKSVRPRRSRFVLLGLLFLTFGSMAFLPTGYVIERPGQVFNVMGTVSGEPVISSDDLEVYSSESRFDVTTVSLVGNRDSTPSWVQVLIAWADPEQNVLPVSEVFPDNRSTQEIRAESTAQMEISQQDAIAAALTHLGYEVPTKLYVQSVLVDSPSSKVLVAGDIVVSAAGVLLENFDQLRSEIQKTEGDPIEIVVERDGVRKSFSITPIKKEDLWVIGSMIAYIYDFPASVSLQLGDVGGPSGGLMFTLGIIDALGEGSLAGDHHVSGTGTINASGKVGNIGGIGLKMIAAKKSGADLFLVPSGNCQEASGQVPEGLPVVSVRDLDDALAAIEQLKSGSEFSSLSCN
jgi:PDZ domain-containing protein